jgi:hypothetical protein
MQEVVNIDHCAKDQSAKLITAGVGFKCRSREKENMKRYFLCWLLFPLLAASAYAGTVPILGSASSFAILGGGGVTSAAPASTIIGDLGACCTTDTVASYPADYLLTGTEYAGSGAPESTAQADLNTAITALEGLGPGMTESELGGQTLTPGVYSSGSTMDLTGTLTLNGEGNANALWVFLVYSSLTTATSSNVIVENAGPGAGVYFVMETGSATLNGSTFEGNVLAYSSITVGTGVTDSCGRLLTETASVTLAGSDTIGIGCSGNLVGSNGLSSGGVLDTQTGKITALPASIVPEPSSFWFLALCLAGLAILRERSRARN